jgi:hypothetical protein
MELSEVNEVMTQDCRGRLENKRSFAGKRVETVEGVSECIRPEGLWDVSLN